MLKHPKTTLDRVRQFIERELRDRLVSDSIELKTRFCQGSFANERAVRNNGDWRPIQKGFKWGPAYQEGWYGVSIVVPPHWKGREIGIGYGSPTVLFEKPDMVEGTVWRNNEPVGGLDYAHHLFRLPQAVGGEKFEIFVQTYAHNTETRVHGTEPPRTKKPEAFHGFLLLAVDTDIWPLYFDCEFYYNLVTGLDEDSPARHALLRALNDVCNTFRPGSPRAINDCRRLLRDAAKVLPDRIGHTVTPVGHAHLDTAWLWPLAVTRLKMAHTTAVQLDLCERYPEHVFAHSQASQYEWLELKQPALFERVKAAVKQGQWEPVGSMWVEADCNLTGAESLVRQFLYGRRYFKKHFGETTDDMWLPDVFGYSAALPQILTKFNIKYFLTQKLSWNQYNKIPNDTFWWQGIDGSKVWSHFPPAWTYIASGEPKQIIESIKNYKDHARSDRSLLLYGFGDGGGGPTEWHLERLRRARTSPCLPTIEKKKRALDFFQAAYEESQDLMTWAGELYFELHRGTYTSQAANKKANRECEFLLRDAEWLACYEDPSFKSYPAKALEEAWKLVLLNQFHDIIPGSSVKEVYEDSAADYASVRTSGQSIVLASLKAIAAKHDTSSMASPVAVFHNASIPGQVELTWTKNQVPQSVTYDGEFHPIQLIEEFGERKLVFKTPERALGAVAVVDLTKSPPTSTPRIKSAARRIENADFCVKFDTNGNVTSVTTQDDEPIEFIEQGRCANAFQLFDDHPLFWDAWDVEAYNLETMTELNKCESVEVVENGPVRAAIEVVRLFGDSRITQRISLGPTPGIRFDTEIDWREENKMLKVAFPLNVNSNRATFEIQFGHVERPTHSNTSWDMAQFEVCAQKWADLSEGGHGVALLNDGKYGHDIKGSTMRLTILRAPKSPDPTCDIGTHRFTYVLLPHYDQLQHSDVVAAAYALNAKPRTALIKPQKASGKNGAPFVVSDTRSVVIEAVKKAEDSNLLLVRAYECHNTRGSGQIVFGRTIKNAWLADLDENPLQKLEVVGNAVKFDYRPFEIMTILVE